MLSSGPVSSARCLLKGRVIVEVPGPGIMSDTEQGLKYNFLKEGKKVTKDISLYGQTLDTKIFEFSFILF